MGKKVKSSKRKARENDDNTVLSHKIHEDKDENDLIFDPNEPTMGEKLAALDLLEKNEGSKDNSIVASKKSKPPSVDSVNVLLKQLLNADDRTRLMECLSIKDDKVITNSISMLNPSDVLKFLEALIPIIQLRGAVIVRALPWLKSLLLQHAGVIMSQEASLAALNSLYQVIESRVSTFDQSLQLSSSLDLLYTETIDDEKENAVVTPVIFEDTDGSGDEGSEDSMDIEGDKDGEISD